MNLLFPRLKRNGVVDEATIATAHKLIAKQSDAYNRPVIESYKKQYGENWQVRYEKCKNGELLLSLHESSLAKRTRYQAKSKLAQDMFGSTKKNIK